MSDHSKAIETAKRVIELDAKATPEPWAWDGDVCNYDPEQEAPWLSSEHETVLGGEIRCKNEGDRDFIADSRTSCPQLAAAVFEMAGENECLQSELETANEIMIQERELKDAEIERMHKQIREAT